MISNMPGSVEQRKVVVGSAQAKRTGLVGMAAESQHNIPIVIDGVERTVICTARHHEDVPRARARFICLHDRCRGKHWPTFEAMQDAHPQASQMAKRDEVHVYGLWSDDPQAEGPWKAAEAAVAEARAEVERAKKAIKEAKGVGEREMARDDLSNANTALLAAQADLGRVAGVIGLIAPADRA